MKTVTISVRLPKTEAGRIEKMAREMGMERSTFMKRALRRGTEDLLFDRAANAYRAGEATLSRAAEIAGIGVRDMLLRMRDAGLELHYTVEDLEKDLRP